MKKLSGHTQHFAVLGHPIGHSLSPVMHNASIEALGLDAIYLAFDVHPNRLMDVLVSMRDMGFAGVNLTVPLKEVAFNGFSELDDTAQLFGAVNTVVFTTDGMRGHNTDGYGFLKAMDEAFGPSIKDEQVFVLGTGGAGRAIALVCAKQGARSITLSDTAMDRCEKVAREIEHAVPGTEIHIISPDQQVAAARKSNVIVQSTPVGMKREDPSLLTSDAFRAGQKVFDLIYMYPETKLLQTAREAGAATANGIGMLLHQGARAFTIWTGQDPEVEVMRKALENAVYTS